MGVLDFEGVVWSDRLKYHTRKEGTPLTIYSMKTGKKYRIEFEGEPESRKEPEGFVTVIMLQKGVNPIEYIKWLESDD